ncbi:hypothetical protein CF68_06245 [Cupriavidus sp. SK-4]|uniref:hypothetical protein n=1 Tax=Cupriavidus sp. SK-4 TaxID=574750 RepID=UPI00044C8394|nr:hypothetical protein [Cupriavidus sp. SK-4]EYS86328.1 hypothetical protein CF68_06245 [Cupriavidus sp. SK-4]
MNKQSERWRHIGFALDHSDYDHLGVRAAIMLTAGFEGPEDSAGGTCGKPCWTDSRVNIRRRRASDRSWPSFTSARPTGVGRVAAFFLALIYERLFALGRSM